MSTRQRTVANGGNSPNTDSVPRKFVMRKKMPAAHCGGLGSSVARTADGMPAAARTLNPAPEY
ncbi:hypothetical protein [Burkholderia orbicola]|uniref:hypothetical protein n=1 Tax=Burkholderia orbicola TaxID=2978683 RepID=UPI0026500164|nr:hypothetical protein [Burkholderia orbicola]MDN7558654.1 hypothetical protein [Burkholderia orbicola]